MYARTVQDQVQFGPLLSYDQAVMQLTEMMPMPWDMWPEVDDAGMDAEYSAYWAEHPFPRLTDPAEPVDGEGGGEDDDGGGDGGRGRRRWRGVVGERRLAPRREGGQERAALVVRGRGGLPLQVPAAQGPREGQRQVQPEGQRQVQPQVPIQAQGQVQAEAQGQAPVEEEPQAGTESGDSEEDEVLRLREICQGQADEIEDLVRERNHLRIRVRDTERERDQAIQRYTEAETALRVGRRAAEDAGAGYVYVLRAGEEIAYWRDLYYAAVPADQRARSFHRSSRTATATGGSRRRQTSSGGVMGPPPPPERQGDPGAGPSTAQTPSRQGGSEGGSSS